MATSRFDTLILNFRKEDSTEEEKNAGVVDFVEDTKKELVELMTFKEFPSPKEMEKRANEVAHFYQVAYISIVDSIFTDLCPPSREYVLLDGQPAYFQKFLLDAFKELRIDVLYSWKSVQARENGKFRNGKLFVPMEQEFFEIFNQEFVLK